MACADGTPTPVELSVDVITDFAPGVEFTAVESELVEFGDTRTSPALNTPAQVMSFLGGRRVADFDEVQVGTRELQVRLLRADGSVLATRNRVITVRNDIIVPVVFTRVCADVVCPGAGDDPNATECVDGVCVPPECGPEHPEECPVLGCATAGDCDGPPLPSCASRTCVARSCLVERDDSACGPGFYCDPEDGCTQREMSDAGRPPPMVDAGMGDAGPVEACPGEGDPCELEEGSCAQGIVTCAGDLPSCVPDGPKPEGTECRPAADDCDAPEVCDGSSLECPAVDSMRGADVTCRASAGPCDVAEQCDGVNPACPGNDFVDAGTSCSGGFCNGMDAACQTGCDPGASCSPPGESACALGELDCSTDPPTCRVSGPADAGTPCRAAMGPCDLPDTCNGSSTTCPDRKRSPSFVCRPADASGCDVDDFCDGTSNTCGANDRRPAGFMCDPTTCPGWGACGEFPSACAETGGTERRTCTQYMCNASGNCVGSALPQSQSCTRDSDGLSCPDGACITGNCQGFGGIWGEQWGDGDLRGCLGNPFAGGACACPPGFAENDLEDLDWGSDEGNGYPLRMHGCTPASVGPGSDWSGGYGRVVRSRPFPEECEMIGDCNPNPLTGSCSCPPGSTAMSMEGTDLISGQKDCVVEMTVCRGPASPQHFGGWYRELAPSEPECFSAVSSSQRCEANPVTGNCTCPSGFTGHGIDVWWERSDIGRICDALLTVCMRL